VLLLEIEAALWWTSSVRNSASGASNTEVRIRPVIFIVRSVWKVMGEFATAT
jgi:hypothetical protein